MNIKITPDARREEVIKIIDKYSYGKTELVQNLYELILKEQTNALRGFFDCVEFSDGKGLDGLEEYIDKRILEKYLEEYISEIWNETRCVVCNEFVDKDNEFMNIHNYCRREW